VLLFCIHFKCYTVAMKRNLFDDGYDHWVPPHPISLHPISDIRKHEVYVQVSTHIPLNGMTQRQEKSAWKSGRWKHNNHKRITVGTIHWDSYWGHRIVEYCDIREQKSLFLTLSTVFTVWLTVTLFFHVYLTWPKLYLHFQLNWRGDLVVLG
jgi:hypothetical protein